LHDLPNYTCHTKFMCLRVKIYYVKFHLLDVLHHALHHNSALLEQELNHTCSGSKTSLLFDHMYLSD